MVVSALIFVAVFFRPRILLCRPTEGLLIAMAVLVSTRFEGVQLWSKPVENYISLPEPILNYFDRAGHELKLLDLFVSFVMLALVFGHAPSW